MADLIKLGALGGLDENGRDCYFLEINDDIFIIECGISLPDKTIPGVDFLLPNPDYLVKNKNRIRGYFISHGHDEAMSGLKFIYSYAPAPVYCSRETQACIEGQAHIYHIKTKFNYVIVEPSSTFMVSGHEIRFFQTCHNVSGSSGMAFLTDKGWIVYSGDYIIDFDYKSGYHFDFKALSAILDHPVFLLMSESKSATKSGYCSPKHRIKKIIEPNFRDENKRIFICSFWQNVYRLNEILDLCRQYKKKLFPYNEYTRQILVELSNVVPDFLKGIDVLANEDFSRVREQDLVVLIVGHNEKMYELIGDLGINQNDDKRIILGKNDIFINASLPGITAETACTRAMDKIYRSGCDVQWLKSKDCCSMHAREDDVKFLLYLLKPKYYFPIRGNFTALMANAKIALSMGIGLNYFNIFVMDNGMVLSFNEKGKPSLIPQEKSEINIVPLLADGLGLSLVESDNVIDRVRMSEDGVVVIAASVSLNEKKIMAGPDCQMRGFVFVKESEPLLKSISNIFVDEINTAFTLPYFNVEQVKANIEDRVKKFVRRENGRQPYIIPIINVLE